MTLKLTMTCGPYDRAQALIDGSVRPDGVKLDITVDADDVRRQQRCANGDFDICEFYTVSYIADRPFRTLGFTAIPIFVKRMFRHSYIYINRRSGIRTPRDLNGKTVGVQTWITSAAVWAKGMLVDDHGVDLSTIRWIAQRPVRVPGWCPPPWLRLELRPDDEQYDLLVSGVLDAVITTEINAPGRHADVDFLFPDYPEREREYFKRTRCFPIMHTLLIRDTVLEQHPWVARALYDAWQRSKQQLYKQQEWERIHKTSLWYRGLWEEEHEAVGDTDTYPWGLTKCRHELEVLLHYCREQGVTSRVLTPEELFDSSTLDT